MILLPFLALFVWMLAFRRGGRDWLESAVAAFVVFGIAVVLATELQSAIGRLDASASAAAWIILALAGLLAARRAAILERQAAVQRPDVAALLPVLLMLVMTGLVALIAAPNSYDGLTYHLVRVERWIQQGSVRPFATWNTRQLFMPPWTEYVMLQFRLLSGGDHLANLVQWLSLAGACGGASLLSRSLGGGRLAAATAAALVATLPMAVAQASGTQTDVAGACWAVLAAAFGYRLLTESSRPTDLLCCAAAVALSAETKQTSALFAGIALIPVIGMLAWQGGLRRALALMLAIAVATSVIAGPQLARNQEVFGSWLGDPVWRNDVAMTARAPNQVAGNVLRNLALHFGTPWDGVNAGITHDVAGISRAIGADPDDQRTTWNTHFIPTPWNTHEESAPNPLQAILVIGCLVALAWKRPNGPQFWFPLAVMTGFVVFCVELKWQSYNSRLQTPLFVLALAWCAVWLERAPRMVQRVVLAVVTLAALPGALFNYTRPLFTLPGGAITPRSSVLDTPRQLGYFAYDPPLAEPYIDVARKIARSGCVDVGMHTWPDGWEYPLMALVHGAGSPARFRAIGVTNASARYETNRAAPCLLLQIWTEAGTPPAWAADWRMLAQWDVAPGRPGIALFGPPR